MAKVLFVSSIQIFPPLSGGQLRSAQFVQTLTELGHEVSIYSFTARKETYVNLKSSFFQWSFVQRPVVGICETVNSCFVWGLVQWLFYKFRLPPLWIYLVQSLCPLLGVKHLVEKCDFVVFDFPFVFNDKIARRFAGKVLLNTHNCEFDLFRSGEGHFFKFLSQFLVKLVEQKAVSESDFVACCSELDMARIQFLYENMSETGSRNTAKYAIVPNGVNSKSYLKPKDFNKPQTRIELGYHPTKCCFVFPGSAFGPNQQALNTLRDWVNRDRIRLTELDVEFWIVGSVSEKDFSDPLIKCTGPVSDVKCYLWAADFGINPVQSGSGVNVKMIEFISAGLMVLSTRVGMRGLRLDSESSLLIEQTSFLPMIEKACQMTQDERSQMAMTALDHNRELIDMKASLSKLILDMELSNDEKLVTIDPEISTEKEEL